MAAVGNDKGTPLGDGEDGWSLAVAEVDAAYQLRDSLAADDQLRLQRHAARARELLSSLEPAAHERPLLMLLQGKLLDASSGSAHSPEAEELLTRAVKLDPRSVDVWNTLAECLWKGGQLELARACYHEALRVRTNSDTLCQLSMLQRTISNLARGADPSLVLDSLRLAKEAVQLDVECGLSWYVLGNALLSSYFAATHRLDDLHSALKAYKRAASTARRPQGGNADLHYNTGVVLSYLLDFEQSAASFARAQQLGPELNAEAQRRALLAFGRKCADTLGVRGHLPRKRLQQLERALQAASGPPPAAGRLAAVAVGALRAGPNPLVCLSAAVVAELVPAAQTPLCYALVDSTGETILLCVYNTVQSAIQVYQTVTVLAPHRRTIRLSHGDGGAETCFDVLVVDEPVSQLLVQGAALASAHVCRARVTTLGSVTPRVT